MSNNTQLPDEKQCTKCGETKSVSAFGKDARLKSGFRADCKVCHALYCAQWRKEHADEIAQYSVQWRQEHHEEIAQYNAQWRQDHPQYDVQWAKEHAEEKAHNNAQWRKANPDKCRAARNRRRARKLGNGGSHTAADIQRQGDLQYWLCWWRMPGCAIDCKDDYHVDHLVPLARGGHNNPSNIVISCPHCNYSKNDKTPDEFAGRLL